MTVRGFLAWYLGSVTMASALGAVMWYDIHVRRHVDSVAVIAPAIMQAQVATANDVPPAIAAVEATQATPNKAVSAGPRTVSTPVSPPRVTPSAGHAARVAGNTAKARPVIRTARRAPSYHRPGLPAPGLRDWEAYPGYASAYPQAVFAPWQMQPYAGYYAYRRYYPSYPYYSAY
jgi:hypothetical protein